ncbi:glycosyltransferase family 4 protein [Enterovibrio norvegicus]|uniref:glycosyltransferase family 4 protein n=1 Tax=Enterovibrio norvegicus TaxID=188144 RepID=UPI0002E33931|nr:glycosyltransferase family 1 protein [Enterovibrio norvegicus]
MKVLINITPIRYPLTGIGYYTLNILQTLLENDVDVIGFHPGRFIQKPELREIVDNFVASPLDAEDGVPDAETKNAVMSKKTLKRRIIEMIRFVPGTYRLRSAYFQYRISSKLNELAGEGYVYFEPNYIPFKYSGPILTTVHDLSFVTYPEFHPKERVDYLKVNMVESIKNSSHIIVDSDFILEEMHKNFPESKGKTSTVHLAVSDAFKPQEKDSCDRVLNKFGLDYKGFTLSVATLEPRKNLKRLVSGFKMLPQEMRKKCPLVLVGDHGWMNADLMTEAKALVAAKEIIITGYLSDSDLKALYASAKVFAYPSLYEGFGLPVVEAMASGVAVITSGVGATAEVSGDSAVHVDPYSEQSICDALSQMITDDIAREEVAAKGLTRAATFKWKTTTEQVLDRLSKISKEASVKLN